jgi:hypothetical protein
MISSNCVLPLGGSQEVDQCLPIHRHLGLLLLLIVEQ